MCTDPVKYMHLKKKSIFKCSELWIRKVTVNTTSNTDISQKFGGNCATNWRKGKKQENNKTLGHIEQCFHGLKIHHPSISYLLHFLGVARLEPVQLTGRDIAWNWKLVAGSSYIDKVFTGWFKLASLIGNIFYKIRFYEHILYWTY